MSGVSPSLNPIITIDGPAASGKSSVSREIAKNKGWNWVSTGAFYRGLALASIKAGIDPENEGALVELARSSSWSVEMTAEKTMVFIDGADVTDEINSEKTGSVASNLSQHPGVRAALLQPQRDCALVPPGLVAEGRDCGTVIFPEAHLKVYLTADSENRAKRRAMEQGLELDQTVKDQQERDERDAKRSTAPMQVPENALVIDTSKMDFAAVLAKVQEAVAETFPG